MYRSIVLLKFVARCNYLLKQKCFTLQENGIDPDQTAPYMEQSDQGLTC